MMKNSFREFGEQSKTSTVKIEMQNLSKLLCELVKTPNYPFLSQFCEVASKYIQELTDIMPIILMQKTKEIVPGKILVVCFEKYAFQLGILLGYTGKSFEKILRHMFSSSEYLHNIISLQETDSKILKCWFWSSILIFIWFLNKLLTRICGMP